MKKWEGRRRIEVGAEKWSRERGEGGGGIMEEGKWMKGSGGWRVDEGEWGRGMKE